MRTYLKDELKSLSIRDMTEVLSIIRENLGVIRSENMNEMNEYQAEKGKYFYTDTYKEYEKFDDALFESIVRLEDVERALEEY